MSTFAFVVIAIAVIITSFISGILGMAGGMILMGVLLALVPVPVAMMLHGTTQMASNGWRAWLWREHINWRVFWGTVYGGILVVAVFSALQFSASRAVVYIILGCMPFVSYVLPESLRLNVDKPWHPFICGVVCTIMTLLSGVAGPLLDVFFIQSKMDRKGVVATKAMSQTVSHIIKVLYFGGLLAAGKGSIDWWFALGLIVLAMFGTTLSRQVLEKMSDVNFRNYTRWTLSVIGVYYLCTGVWMLMQAR